MALQKSVTTVPEQSSIYSVPCRDPSEICAGRLVNRDQGPGTRGQAASPRSRREVGRGRSGAIPLSRPRFVQGDFVGGGSDGAQTNRDGTGDCRERETEPKQIGDGSRHGTERKDSTGTKRSFLVDPLVSIEHIEELFEHLPVEGVLHLFLHDLKGLVRG